MGHLISLTVERTTRKEYTIPVTDAQYQDLLKDGTVPNLESYQNDLSILDDTQCDSDYDFRVVDAETEQILIPYDNE